ncbi:MAG: hypothetical protein BEN19_02355 [Epulopiscium sp. Nuni2H_MBin003]|nr:MAG: hypothetical protein BEN19_02355 [Epulopiscium sp. Nuni2H_MBin003]
MEAEILQYLESIRNPFLTTIMETITICAESAFLLAIISIIYWCLNKDIAIKLASAILINAVLTATIKGIVKKPRPFELGIVKPLRVETAIGYAFPSGHTSTATAFWGSAVTVFKNNSMLIFSIIIVILTGISRLYLGVHWPTDVLAGVFLGIISVFISDLVWKNKKYLLEGSIIILVISVFFSTHVASAAAALFGIVYGRNLEMKYVNFVIAGNYKYQIKKVIIGMAGIAIIYFGLDKVMVDTTITVMIKYALVMLWITFFAPYLFKKYLVASQ